MLTQILISFKIYFIVVVIFSASQIFSSEDPVRAKNGLVVSASDLASNAGIKILKEGGNAVDAAVATGFALAVTFPQAGNIGGGGFMVIHLNDSRNTTIDFREIAPFSAFEKMFLDSLGNYNPEKSTTGMLSSGVPGTVAGLIYALNKYGTMRLNDVMQPAISLAENGFILDEKLAASINSMNEVFNRYPSSKKIFTDNGGELKAGMLFVQKDLAETLKKIKDKGSAGFYEGSVAEKIVEFSNKNGGLIKQEDLSNYKAVERKPAEGNYRGYKIISMAPPSAGGIILLEALNILENYSFNKEEWGSSEYISKLCEALKYSFADRTEYLGDPDFVNIPAEKLISKEYAQELFKKIKNNGVVSSEKIKPNLFDNHEEENTTHYSVVDKDGNAVSTTYTLNSWFGNGMVVDGAGFLMNNEMDDFSSKPGSANQFGLLGSDVNSIQPHKRMLSSMTPTIILKNNFPFLILGSPGGSTIPTSVLQVILNVIDFGMNIKDAIDAPRIHHQWIPDRIDYEKFGVTEDVRQNLISRGYKMGEVRSLGRVEGIEVDPQTKVYYGHSDKRSQGKAAGY